MFAFSFFAASKAILKCSFMIGYYESYIIVILQWKFLLFDKLAEELEIFPLGNHDYITII